MAPGSRCHIALVAAWISAACSTPATESDEGPRPSASRAPSVPDASSVETTPTGAERAARIAARATRVYVRSRPSAASREIGALRIGRSIALREEGPVSGPGCARGWRAVVPRGYVCLDESTTVDVERDPIIAAKKGRRAAYDRPEPLSWGESLHTPLYRRVPTEAEQARSEYELEKHLARIERLRRARETGERLPPFRSLRALEGVDLAPATGPIPTFLASGATSPWSAVHTPADPRPLVRRVPRRSMIAWTDEFFASGRSWLVTPELLVAPKDRVARFEPSTFAGVHLDDQATLPIAFIRSAERRKFALRGASEVVAASLKSPDDPFREVPRDAPGRLVETDDTWPRLSHVGLTGTRRWQRGRAYLETTDAGRWILERDATVVTARSPRGIALEPGDKWIDVSIHRGTLVAYDGRRPVFATLISPGLHGYKRVDSKPAKGTTPTGTFRIEWKHRSTTMTPNPVTMSYYLTDVPYTQFFHMPFALHGVYWHDRFGEPKSGGCVNLSPVDSKWLFEWTDPRVPDDWHSVRSGPGERAGTWVRIR